MYSPSRLQLALFFILVMVVGWCAIEFMLWLFSHIAWV